MTREELIEQVESFLHDPDGVESASRVDGEDAIGVELTGGQMYFLAVGPA
jgi:hypothetical protein